MSLPTTTTRWYVRCVDCLSIAAIAEPPNVHDMRCALCDGPIETMGRVERNRLVRDEVRSACDDRCTNARGPLCDCHCGGLNHGSHRVVHVIRDAGPIPKIAMPDNFKAKRAAEEYRAARAAALAQLDPLLAARRRGEYLAGGDFRRLRELQRALSHAHQARKHDTRLQTLRAVLPHSWTFTPSPIADFADALNPPNGALGIDVPFSLTREPVPTPTKQIGLFD